MPLSRSSRDQSTRSVTVQHRKKNPRRNSLLENGEKGEAFQGGSVQSPLRHVMFDFFVEKVSDCDKKTT